MNRREHIKADEWLLGYSLEWVHQFMDSKSALGLLGGAHRIIRHDVNVLDLIEEIARFREDDPRRGRMVALLHLLIDARILDRDWIENNL